MRYILEVNEQVRPEALQAIFEREIGPEAKDAIMTAGQQLIEQGIERGIQRVLLRLLHLRFGDEVDAHVEHRIATASLEELDAWTMRIVPATTLAELFAD